MSSRRTRVEFDPDHFAKLDPSTSMDSVEVFRIAHREHLWRGSESASGPGSSADQTSRLRDFLPTLLQDLGVASLLDLPCRDFHWMSRVPLGNIKYVGGDIVPEIVSANAELYGTPSRQFQHLDLTRSSLPQSDLILCRDCLVHLSFADIDRALANIARSEAIYLLTTTFPEERDNIDVRTGDWRPLNLQSPPFDLPKPLRLFNEGCTEQDGTFADKSLGLWKVADLPAGWAT